MARRFRVGDAVTWGLGRVAHRVVRLEPHGVVVDASSEGLGELLIEYAPGSASRRCPGPPRPSDLPPQ